MTLTPVLSFATRPSPLARWQTQWVMDALQRAWPGLICQMIPITTRGDRVLDRPLPEIGGKGLFTQELEGQIISGKVRAAVHSLKDLPTTILPGLVIGAIPARGEARDALICPGGYQLGALPVGARLGTSSLRRKAQALALRPDLQVKPVRGNVDSRLRKLHTGEYDALILAGAGLERLGLVEQITSWLPLEMMLPAPGQGALAVQCRQDDEELLGYLSAIEDIQARKAVTAERAFLAALGGGCAVPVGAYAEWNDSDGFLRGLVAAEDGSQVMRVNGRGADPEALGEDLALQALSAGADAVIDIYCP